MSPLTRKSRILATSRGERGLPRVAATLLWVRLPEGADRQPAAVVVERVVAAA